MNPVKKSEEKIEEKLIAFGKQNAEIANEYLIEKTVQKCITAVSAIEEEAILSYVEFFWVQVKLIQKRWWVFQGIILIVAGLLLEFSDASEHMQRGMSVAAALFVILILPEIWKNRETNSMEIEESSFYSLKQIYSVKILAFGLVDICMLTMFCFVITSTQHVPVYSLLTQLVFPLMVATGICFAILSSKKHFGEIVAIFTCIIVNGLWAVMITNGNIYDKITPILWNILFGISGLFVVISICKTIYNCDKYWEGNDHGVSF